MEGVFGKIVNVIKIFGVRVCMEILVWIWLDRSVQTQRAKRAVFAHERSEFCLFGVDWGWSFWWFGLDYVGFGFGVCGGFEIGEFLF